jgi:hypothetical protein
MTPEEIFMFYKKNVANRCAARNKINNTTKFRPKSYANCDSNTSKYKFMRVRELANKRGHAENNNRDTQAKSKHSAA